MCVELSWWTLHFIVGRSTEATISAKPSQGVMKDFIYHICVSNN